jgi:acyl-coenzyme A synthetase/AMP-(fatty) acid ligase
MAKQGRAVFGVDMKIVDGDGNELPWDGRRLQRRPAGARAVDRVAATSRARAATRWWTAGSPPATWPRIDADGFMQITDRSKDVIKSGGEWIGSIDLENIAMAHPAVAMAACIAARTPSGTSGRCWWS